MKRWTLLGGSAMSLVMLGVFVIYGQPRPAPADGDKKEKRTISTNGTATIRAKPDSARVFFSVQTMGKTVKTAREENSAKSKGVIDALKALDLRNLKMKTANVSVEILQSSRGEMHLPTILGYRVTNSFTTLVQDADAIKLAANASRILDTVLEYGANQIQQIVFFKQDETEIRREALTNAVQDALANARALARGARVQVGETTSISGQPEYYYGSPMLSQVNAAMVAAPGGGDTPVVAGDLEITCHVNITCSH
jgi:uncharacterized protein YggE